MPTADPVHPSKHLQEGQPQRVCPRFGQSAKLSLPLPLAVLEDTLSADCCLPPKETQKLGFCLTG